MYSPKIKDEFIPVIYRLARSRGVRMTHLVNQIISEALKEAINEQNRTLAAGEETSPPEKVNGRNARLGNTPGDVPHDS